MRTVLMIALTCGLLLGDTKQSVKRLEDSAVVFSEIMRTPDRGIPQELLEKAYCVVIVPGLKKGAFLVGGQYGKGYLSCRNKNGEGWSAPEHHSQPRSPTAGARNPAGDRARRPRPRTLHPSP
jgi:lipid-binding SYLF domain-containing protein